MRRLVIEVIGMILAIAVIVLVVWFITHNVFATYLSYILGAMVVAITWPTIKRIIIGQEMFCNGCGKPITKKEQEQFTDRCEDCYFEDCGERTLNEEIE